MTNSKYSSSLSNSVLFFLFAATVIVGSLVWQASGGAGDKAEKIAIEKGGFSKVTSVKRDWTTFCSKNTTGFHVEGIRDDSKTSVTVCVSAAPWGSYVR